MDKFLADRIQLTVDNYRLVKEELSCYPPQIMCIDIHKSLSEEIEKQYVLSKGIDRNTIYPQNSDTSNITNWLMEIGLL